MSDNVLWICDSSSGLFPQPMQLWHQLLHSTCYTLVIFSVMMLHMDLSCFAAPYFHNFLLGWASHYHSLVSLHFPLSVSSHSDLILLPSLEILMTSWNFGMTCKSCNYMDHPLLKVYTVWYRVPWVAAAILSSLQKWLTPVSLFLCTVFMWLFPCWYGNDVPLLSRSRRPWICEFLLSYFVIIVVVLLIVLESIDFFFPATLIRHAASTLLHFML
jgi:hypothetical protein